jgi:hypothetical protein
VIDNTPPRSPNITVPACSFCEQNEANWDEWSFLVCADCTPGLREAVQQAVDAYRATRQQ